MSLDHALLVSLLEKPSSGYELARRFDRSIGYFWHATHQQIYKVLARMEEAGWISGEVQAGEVGARPQAVFRQPCRPKRDYPLAGGAHRTGRRPRHPDGEVARRRLR
jgi:hypothetical protein